ncbi:MAG: glycoside hydrolase family 127 protein [Parachlamydia sp.]|jgi:hypothetical protein|nr:glycoside hydrolase family 127 protein [Parachlamydia sp.]
MINLDQIMTASGFSGEVNLFIASKKKPTLKKMDLTQLTLEQKLRKLNSWSKDQRFVAVVERGDVVFAFTSPHFAENLQSQHDLTVNGKKVAVKALSDQETDRLNAIVETFEDFVRLNPEEEIEDEKEEERARARRENDTRAVKDNLARANLLSAALMDYLILHMQNIPNKIKKAFLKKMEEVRREQERVNKELDIKDEQRQQEIKQNDLKKRVVQEDIIKVEIKSQTRRVVETAAASKKPAPFPLDSPSPKKYKRK